jgi:hypothetical protein
MTGKFEGSSPTFAAIASILASRTDTDTDTDTDEGMWRLIEAELEDFDVETDYAELRTLAADVAWELRLCELPAPEASYVALVNDKAIRTFFSYVRGQMLRYDFRFTSLHEFVEIEVAKHPHDALLLALYGLALAGLQDPAAREVLAASVESPNADLRSRHCSLHGYWVATHLDDQADLLIAMADAMIEADEVDCNVMFRRAYGLRRKGLVEKNPLLLSEALRNISDALELSPPNPDVNQDYVRERELIALSQMFLLSQGASLNSPM